MQRLIDQIREAPLNSGPWVKEVELLPKRLELHVLTKAEFDASVYFEPDIPGDHIAVTHLCTTKEIAPGFLPVSPPVQTDVIRVFGIVSSISMGQALSNWGKDLELFWSELRNLPQAMEHHTDKPAGIFDGGMLR